MYRFPVSFNMSLTWYLEAKWPPFLPGWQVLPGPLVYFVDVSAPYLETALFLKTLLSLGNGRGLNLSIMNSPCCCIDSCFCAFLMDKSFSDIINFEFVLILQIWGYSVFYSVALIFLSRSLQPHQKSRSWDTDITIHLIYSQFKDNSLHYCRLLLLLY